MRRRRDGRQGTWLEEQGQEEEGRQVRGQEEVGALNPAALEPTIDTLREITAAFNRHDLDAIMSFFTDDAVFESPRGAEPWGRRFAGSAAVREGLAARFTGIPDVHYGEDDHFVAGDRGASEWTLTGTTTDGKTLEIRGCDLWTFRDGLVTRKDSFWKIRVEPDGVPDRGGA